MPKNNLTKNVSQIVMPTFLKSFASDLVLTKTVNRQILSGKINNKTGDSVQVKRPHQFKTEETDDGNLTTRPSSELISATATARVDKYISVKVEWSQLEEAIELNQLDTILSPIARTMATALETRLAKFMLRNGALNIGIAGTGLTKWDEVTRAGSLFTDLGVVGSKTYAAISPWAGADLAGQQIGIPNEKLVGDAWKKAQIPRNFAGLDAVFTTNSLTTRTTGAYGDDTMLTVAADPVVNYVDVKDTYQFTVTLTGATPDTVDFLSAGDQLVFSDTAWVNQMNKEPILGSTGGVIAFTCTVLADADSDSASNVTVTCSGVPIYQEQQPQYNSVARKVVAGDSVMIRGQSGKLIKPSMFYTDDFVGISTIKLPKLHSIDSSIISWQGLSIRAHKWSDGMANNQYMRFDLLPAFACFNPHKGGQLFGGTGV
ncbi:P22 phage major capsid protein family protein [Klebsiella aerogenes]|uniref:P22 phage major capsid protein family protein n=1 Tax=Klebsiella aerogenes TaxID=548 RepID=UPI00351D70B2